MSAMAVAVLAVTLQSGFPVWLHFCSNWGHQVKPNKAKHFLQAEPVGSSQEMRGEGELSQQDCVLSPVGHGAVTCLAEREEL